MKKIVLALIVTLLFIVACKKKTEGPTGKATIKGKIYVQDFNSSFTKLNSQYFGAKEDVYIIYGDEEIYGDDMETHSDGSYKFEHLTPGTYTIFSYSEDSSLKTSNLIPISKTVEITGKDEVVEIEKIVILK